MNDFVQADASDGFVLAPHLTPSGLDDFVDLVVPLLQERGVLRTEYETTTLREHLGLGPARPAAAWTAAARAGEAALAAGAATSGTDAGTTVASTAAG